jgi:glycosyltransferase involved in cell wall biosynthesis
MRFVALVPELVGRRAHGRDRTARAPWRLVAKLAARHPRLGRTGAIRRAIVHPHLYTEVAWGGTLNIMRHAALVRSLGVPAVLATPDGHDSYGRFNIVDLPFVRWADRRPDDVVLVPDFVSELVDDVAGPVICYLQVPVHLRADFDWLDPRVRLWTDSPFMLEKCRAVFPGKPIPIVPNVVDDEAFPFIPQSQRESGLVFAFPRKGPEYIEATRLAYRALGGRFWRFELVDGLTLLELAREMRRPQVFLASAEVEGCALPPQESMAAGIVVCGKSARGANFAMEHRETAMIAETPEQAAVSLRELEDAALRDRIAKNAHAFIRRYFPAGEPTDFWRATLRELGFSVRAEGPATLAAPA